MPRRSVLLGASRPCKWLENRETRELRAPWSDAEWNEGRSELFLAALALHRAFLVHAARPMRESLDGAMEILAGNAPRDLPAEAALAAWQALFLEIAACCDRRRSAATGTDHNDPFEVEQAIRAHYGVGEEWLTGRGSVQSLADRLNRLGTTLPGAEGRRWVGAPLAVHRRCDRPMFDISNEIAYDGMMVEATDPALAETFTTSYPTLLQSKWIDIRSETARARVLGGKQAQPAERSGQPGQAPAICGRRSRGVDASAPLRRTRRRTSTRSSRL